MNFFHGVGSLKRIASGSPPALSYIRAPSGDAVIVHGFGIGVERDGGHAEYARVDADSVLRLPDGLSPLDAAVMGAAGYTAALALHWMEQNGLAPDSGKILVSGATGGVASVAIDILAGRGYRVTAMSGKADAHGYLQALGASEIIAPEIAKPSGKPIESAQWAGAVDSGHGHRIYGAASGYAHWGGRFRGAGRRRLEIGGIDAGHGAIKRHLVSHAGDTGLGWCRI